MEATALAHEMRQRIGKRNKAAGASYELKVAKKISGYCGISDWADAFFRTKPSKSQYDARLGEAVAVRVAGAQRAGDIMPIKKMAELWYHRGLGPLEMKYTAEWSLGQMLAKPEKSVIYRYWRESNLNCQATNSILFFSRPHALDYVLCLQTLGYRQPCLLFSADHEEFAVQTLETFLQTMWPGDTD